MRIVKETMSKELQELFLNWVKEEEENHQHNSDNYESWNALVLRLAQLEEGKKDAVPN